MKTFRLTKKGKVVARSPDRVRDPVLDFLYEHKTGTLDEIRTISGEGREGTSLSTYTRLGLVEEVRGSDW